MGPPAGPPADEQGGAKESLERAKKLIEDLENKGFDLNEARSWLDQADEMFKGGLFRTSLIYSGYAYDSASEIYERMKSMLVKITKLKSRANDMLGKDHKDMPRVDDIIEELKVAVNEGRLDDAQELMNAADGMLMGGASPYITVETVGVSTVRPSRGYMSCPSCGNIVETTWIKCSYCDASLVDEEHPVSTGPAWTEGVTGPLLISDSNRRGMPQPDGTYDEEQVDEDLEHDTTEVERLTEEMDRVEADLGEKEEGDAPQEGPKTCPNCGEELEPDFVKCPVCKHQLR
jgi:uncharacterized protein (UPF0212 family)